MQSRCQVSTAKQKAGRSVCLRTCIPMPFSTCRPLPLIFSPFRPHNPVSIRLGRLVFLWTVRWIDLLACLLTSLSQKLRVRSGVAVTRMLSCYCRPRLLAGWFAFSRLAFAQELACGLSSARPWSVWSLLCALWRYVRPVCPFPHSFLSLCIRCSFSSPIRVV